MNKYEVLSRYSFRDELGHPLENCIDYRNMVAALEAARTVFSWYYIFGEDNLAARDHLAMLGNKLADVELHRP